MFQTYDGYQRNAKEHGRLEAAMPCDQLIVPVDENRRVEAERFDALGDRPNLLPTVFSWIACVKRQFGWRHELESNGRRRRLAGASACRPRHHCGFEIG